jgi:hypothetical protein
VTTIDLRAVWREEPRDHRVALVAILVIGLALRLLTLGQPIRYDEATTYLEFARKPLSVALSRYDYPNNHLFHTLLVKASMAAFGSAEWSLRLPAFLAGIVMMPLTYLATRALYNSRAALVATALIASSGAMALYSTNARGYSITICAFLALVLIGAQLIRMQSPRLWAAFAILAAVGVWTIPVMLYPLGAVALWIGLSLLMEKRGREIAWLGGSLAVGGLLTFIAYRPVFMGSGVGAVTSNKFVKATEWVQFFGEIVVTGWETLRLWGLGLPPIVAAAILAAAVIAVANHAKHSVYRVGLPLACYVWSAWLLVATHHAPASRVWLWCVPVIAALAAVQLVAFADSRPRMAAFAKRIPTVGVPIALVGSISVAASEAVLSTHDTGAFLEAESVAKLVATKLRDGDQVIVNIPSNAPLAYYLTRLNVDYTKYVSVGSGSGARRFIVINSDGTTDEQELLKSPLAQDTARFVLSQVGVFPKGKLYLLESRDAAK